MAWEVAANLRGPKGSEDVLPAGAYSGSWGDASPNAVAGLAVDGTARIVSEIATPIFPAVGCSMSQGGVITVGHAGVWNFQGTVQFSRNSAVRAIYFVVSTNPASKPSYGLFGTAEADSMATSATLKLQAGQQVSLCCVRWSGSGLTTWKNQGCTITATWLGDPSAVAATPSRPLIANLTDAATIATDASVADTYRVTLGGNRTLGPPANPTDGQRGIWQISADNSPRTITLDTGAGGFQLGAIVPTINATAANTTDYLGAIYHAGDNRWHVVAYAKGF